MLKFWKFGPTMVKKAHFQKTRFSYNHAGTDFWYRNDARKPDWNPCMLRRIYPAWRSKILVQRGSRLAHRSKFLAQRRSRCRGGGQWRTKKKSLGVPCATGYAQERYPLTPNRQFCSLYKDNDQSQILLLPRGLLRFGIYLFKSRHWITLIWIDSYYVSEMMRQMIDCLLTKYLTRLNQECIRARLLLYILVWINKVLSKSSQQLPVWTDIYACEYSLGVNSLV